MRLDVDPHVQVPWRAAALAGRSLASNLDPLAVADARRDPGLDRPGAHRPSAAGAGLAWVIHDQPTAAAGLARLGEREATEVAAALPGALAGRADPRHGARLGAGALAHLARALAGQPERHRGAVDRVAERQRCLGLHVRAAPRPGLLVVVPPREPKTPPSRSPSRPPALPDEPPNRSPRSNP